MSKHILQEVNRERARLHEVKKNIILVKPGKRLRTYKRVVLLEHMLNNAAGKFARYNRMTGVLL